MTFSPSSLAVLPRKAAGQIPIKDTPMPASLDRGLWLKSFVDLDDHYTTKRLAARLGVEVPHAIGLLVCLWHWASKYADTGDLSHLDTVEIASASRWTGNADDFVSACVQSGFLDQEKEKLIIVDWDLIAGDLIETRRRRADYMKQYRANRANSSPNATADRDSHVTVTKQSRNGLRQDKTRQDNDTNHSFSGENGTPPSKARAATEYTPEFLLRWNRYPKRNGIRAGKLAAFKAWQRLAVKDWDAFDLALDNYSRSRQVLDGKPRDMVNFINKDYWRDWDRPETPPTNGRAPAGAVLDATKYTEGKYSHLFNRRPTTEDLEDV